MDQTSITAASAIDTFLILLIGIGPKLALVPFLTITASLDPAARQQVQRKMLTIAATVALILMVLGELLRTLLHFSIGSLSIAGGVILLVLAVGMALGPPASTSPHIAGKDPMQLAHYPLAVPYLLNPVGIVSLVTISAEAKSLSVFAMELGILAIILLIDAVVFHWANRVRLTGPAGGTCHPRQPETPEATLPAVAVFGGADFCFALGKPPVLVGRY